MIKNVRWGLSACVAAVALALAGGVASAQQKAPEAPAKSDAKKVEPPKAAAPKAAAPKKAAPAKKAASPCAGVEPEATCTGNPECMWVKEYVTKAGVKHKAHCQKKPTPPPAKKAAAPKADAKAPAAAPAAGKAPAAAPAPKAPAPTEKKQ